MNILIKLMSVVSLVLAPWFVRVWAERSGETVDVQSMLDSARMLVTALLG